MTHTITTYTRALEKYNHQRELRNNTASWKTYQSVHVKFLNALISNHFASHTDHYPLIISDHSKLSSVSERIFSVLNGVTILNLDCVKNEATTVSTKDSKKIRTSPVTDCPGRFQVTLTEPNSKSNYLGDVHVIVVGEARLCAWANEKLPELEKLAKEMYGLYQRIKADPAYTQYREAKDDLKQITEELIQSNSAFKLILADTPGRRKAAKWTKENDIPAE